MDKLELTAGWLAGMLSSLLIVQFVCSFPDLGLWETALASYGIGTVALSIVYVAVKTVEKLRKNSYEVREVRKRG